MTVAASWPLARTPEAHPWPHTLPPPTGRAAALPCPRPWRGATFPDNPPASGGFLSFPLRSWL